MRRLLALCLLGACTVAAAQGAPAAPLQLLPGEYLWLPELSPRGPVLMLVSLPEQRAYVYRNGVRIGVATVSTGKPGYETPTGVFTILQKKREHYSNLYDDAPMPFMQRLTWDGVAMHAGRVPGYPASHGCVRLPHAFSEKLFDVTTRGMTVVIVDQANRAPMLADPALFPAPAPKGLPTSTPLPRLQSPAMPEPGYTWAPEQAPPGALTVVVSTLDRQVVVLREGIEIGRGPVRILDGTFSGTLAYLLLEGTDGQAPAVLPDRPRRRWLRVHGEGEDDPARLAGMLGVAPGFSRAVYDAMVPGTSLVITDQALGVASGLTVLQADGPVVPVEPGSGGP
ncbi:MAG: L,D-transpeptidase [Arenimonas sp.]|uniref:L,D-transpeptidase n=1 Tax=Arenimonas sp. TaxID=1872635 RepID=UPI0025C3C21C|nr:L,D-transpeptidase [Arenimonas sp.]MBW8368972.1 L,D-transpeptidase [Arenimonas sp.]